MTPRIYIACLAAYNNGKLHGKWADAVDADDIQAAIDEVLKTSPEPGAEEWAIHDHEGFGSYRVGENPDITELAELGSAIDRHGTIVAEYAAHIGGDLESALESFDEAYQGCFRTLEEYAEQLADDTGMLDEVPDALKNYFDWESFARDMEMNGDVFTIDNEEGCNVFNNV